MILDDLDIEIEDDDGTGYRIGTIRYDNILVQFTIVQDSMLEEGGIMPIGRIPPTLDEHWEEVKKIILLMAK
jgi:hypothetical protein